MKNGWRITQTFTHTRKLPLSRKKEKKWWVVCSDLFVRLFMFECVFVSYRVSIGTSWPLPPLLSTCSWVSLTRKREQMNKMSWWWEKKVEPRFRVGSAHEDSLQILQVLFGSVWRRPTRLSIKTVQLSSWNQLPSHHLPVLLSDLCFHENLARPSRQLAPANVVRGVDI